MRLLIISICGVAFATCFGFSKPKTVSLIKDQTLIIFFNSEAHYPSQITIDQFWLAQDDLDTMIVLNDRLNSLLDKNISQLQDTLIDTGGSDEFHYAVAFLRERKGLKDTVYASPSFRYWKKRDKDFIDRSGFFQKALGSFLLR